MSQSLFREILLGFVQMLCCLVLMASSSLADEPVRTISLRTATEERATGQRHINDLYLLFGNYIHESPACYQAALSNYIEDQWNRTAKEESCTNDDVLCNKYPRALAEIKGWMIRNPDADATTKQKIIAASNVWQVEGTLRTFMRPIQEHFDPDSKAMAFVFGGERIIARTLPAYLPPDQMKARLDEMNSYVSSCGSRKPQTWAIVGRDYGADNLAADYAKEQYYAGLQTNIILGQLPDEQKAYAGCMANLNYVFSSEYNHDCNGNVACIESIPVDKKEDLMRDLEEIKTHRCDQRYIREMYNRLYPAESKHWPWQ